MVRFSVPKVESTPFIDENGNLVIPPGLLHARRRATGQAGAPERELIALISGVRLRILIRDGKVHSVTRIDEEPDDCSDLAFHARGSMEFWDNPEDDAAWNDVETA